MAKIHNPIIQHMRRLTYQQAHTVLWWTQQSLRRWHTKKNNVQKIQPFILKSGDSINNQPNDNGPDAKLKSLYNVVKSVLMLNYGKKKFSPHHMKSVLVEA